MTDVVSEFFVRGRGEHIVTKFIRKIKKWLGDEKPH